MSVRILFCNTLIKNVLISTMLLIDKAFSVENVHRNIFLQFLRMAESDLFHILRIASIHKIVGKEAQIISTKYDI